MLSLRELSLGVERPSTGSWRKGDVSFQTADSHAIGPLLPKSYGD